MSNFSLRFLRSERIQLSQVFKRSKRCWKLDGRSKRSKIPFSLFWKILTAVDKHGEKGLIYRRQWVCVQNTCNVAQRFMDLAKASARPRRGCPDLSGEEAQASGRFYAELVMAIRPIYKKTWPHLGKIPRELKKSKRLKRAFLRGFSERLAVLIPQDGKRDDKGLKQERREIRKTVKDLRRVLEPRKFNSKPPATPLARRLVAQKSAA